MRSLGLRECILSATLLTAATYAQAQESLPSPPQDDLKHLEFTGPDKGWPPQVVGAEKIEILPYELLKTSITPAFSQRLGEIALSSDIVRKALGERFAFIEAILPEYDKEARLQILEQSTVKAMFYSYSRNVAIQATVRSGEVLEVRDLEGYQPPESPEEIDQAIKLAVEHPVIKELATKYEARGLLTENGEGERGAGHRLIYVSFMRPGSADSEYFALVDLTDNVVLDAGQVAAAE